MGKLKWCGKSNLTCVWGWFASTDDTGNRSLIICDGGNCSSYGAIISAICSPIFSSSSFVSSSISTSSFFFSFSPLFLFFLFSFFFLPLFFLHIPVWRFPQISLSFPGSGAPGSRTLSIPGTVFKKKMMRLPMGKLKWCGKSNLACVWGWFASTDDTGNRSLIICDGGNCSSYGAIISAICSPMNRTLFSITIHMLSLVTTPPEKKKKKERVWVGKHFFVCFVSRYMVKMNLLFKVGWYKLWHAIYCGNSLFTTIVFWQVTANFLKFIVGEDKKTMKIFVVVMIFSENFCSKLGWKYVWPQNYHDKCSDNPMSLLFTIESAPPKRNTQKPHSSYWACVAHNYHDNFSNNPRSFLEKSRSNF